MSPLLANIYLHDLDEFMAEMQVGFDKGKQRSAPPEYWRLTGRIQHRWKRIHRLKAQGLDDDPAIDADLRDIEAAHSERDKLPARDPFDPSFRRLRYCRYADDFLIGIIGSKQDACEVMAQVRDFLTSHLKLRMSEEKSKIVKATDGARFLGYDVVTYTAACSRKITRKGRAYTARSTADVLQLHVPWEKVAKFCTEKEYGNWESMRAAPRLALTHCHDAEIVMTYNAEIRGFGGYYALAKDVRKKLNKLAAMWSRSLGLTLGRKHKCTATQALRRWKSGRNYVIRYQVKGQPKTVRLWRQRDPLGRVNPLAAVDHLPNTAVFTTRQVRSILATFVKDRCELCDTKNVDCETHVIRYLANVSGRSVASLTPTTHTRTRLYVCAPCLADLRSRRSAVQGHVP